MKQMVESLGAQVKLSGYADVAFFIPEIPIAATMHGYSFCTNASSSFCLLCLTMLSERSLLSCSFLLDAQVTVPHSRLQYEVVS